MKTKKQMIRIKTVVMTLLTVATVSLIGCKDDKEEEKIVTPPAIAVVHAINGEVLDKTGKEIVGVEVALSGEKSATTTTDAKGQFVFTAIEKGGNYTITVKKATYNTTNVHFVFTADPKASISMFVPITMMAEGVKQEVTKADGATIELGNRTEATPNVQFVVPANALSETKTITITPVAEVANKPSGSTPAEVKNELPLLTLECAPEGLQFAEPCQIVIPNPFAAYSIKGLKLMYYKNGTWTAEETAVAYNGTHYTTSISHFSTYQVAFETVLVSTTPSTETIAIEGFDNLSGKSDKKIETLPYEFKSGYAYVKPVSEILSAVGVTGDDLTKMTLMVTEAISGKNNGAIAGLKTIRANHPVNTVIPVGVRLDAKAVQNYATVTYKIEFLKDATIIPVVVAIKVAGTASVTTSTYNKQHQGGNVGQ